MADLMKSIGEMARERFEQELALAVRGISRPNIMLLGRTGSGKSTLVNTVFGERLAEVSDARPETRGFHTYSVDNIPVNIIDTEGAELDNEDRFREALNRYIDENFADLGKQVHICWYCISVGGGRVLPFDVAAIRSVRGRGIAVAVVLTQADLDTAAGDTARAMRGVIDREFDSDVLCFEVSSDKAVNQQLGQLNELLEWSEKNIPDANLRLGFIAAQRVSLAQKEHAAEMTVRRYAAVAGGVGATPIPVSDALVLTGLQMKMSADIYAIFGFDNTLRHGLQDLIQGKVASALGRMIAGNIAKMVPVGGSVVGAVINAGVASSVTYALGRTVVAACSAACREAWNGNTLAIDAIFDAENLYKMFNDMRDKFRGKTPKINADDAPATSVVEDVAATDNATDRQPENRQ